MRPSYCKVLSEEYKQCIYKNNDQYTMCKKLLEELHKCHEQKSTKISL